MLNVFLDFKVSVQLIQPSSVDWISILVLFNKVARFFFLKKNKNTSLFQQKKKQTTHFVLTMALKAQPINKN
jgi:hypothetical protein